MSEVDQLLGDLARLDIELWEESGNLRFSAPPKRLSSELRQAILNHREPILARLASTAKSGANRRLPLTDLQRAYWLAEQESTSPTAGYWYAEYVTAELDLPRLEECFRRLAERHEALRMITTADGTQKILAPPARYPIEHEDLRELSSATLDARLAATRQDWRSPRAPLDTWPLINLLAQQTRTGWHFHVGGRLIVLDGMAWDELCQELSLLYRDLAAPLPPLQQSYSGAILEERARSERQGRALEWWCSRSLPGPPALPYRRDFEPSARRWFERKSQRLGPEDTALLRQRCQSAGVTLNALLLTAYGETLRAWSDPHFSITMLLTNPRHLRADGHWPLSNGASTLLLELDLRQDQSLAARARQVQARLAEDMTKLDPGGIAVTREVARRRGVPAQPNPVVFASTVGMDTDDSGRFGMDRLGWRSVQNYMQTPDVLLDHQVYAHNGMVLLNWDYVGAAFESGVVEAMFAAYLEIVQRALDPIAWQTNARARCATSAARDAANATHAPRAPGCLHDFASLARDSSELALVDGADRLSYRELIRRAWGVARRVRGVKAFGRAPVPVLARRRRDQLIGALGVMLSGGAYLPIDPDTPNLRLQKCLESVKPALVLADRLRPPGISTSCDWLDLAEMGHAEPGEQLGAPEDLAYVIFTSGSTGTPKGVAIEHRAARNTIDDLLARWPLTRDDAVLAVSKFAFDLSVYDLFGALAVGAKIVAVEEEKGLDPAHWCTLIQREHVTVWNSVPALMELLVEHAEEQRLVLPLRLVLLSGDWIGKTLPARVRRIAPNCTVIALGGATEASIWSNYFDTIQLDSTWPSIPYGAPLSNQTMHVLDERLEPRPDFCEGDLYLGGLGLAREYWGDPKLTRERFSTHPRTGQRLYRTGDRARYWPDGLVEFLGRSDAQVKLRGHRVELGEIEAALCAQPGILAARALVFGARERSRLGACVVAERDLSAELPALAQRLRELLPPYMIPSPICQVERLPLTTNGKVDRAALASTLEQYAPARDGADEPLSPVERSICRIWTDLLGQPHIRSSDTFYDLGGDSLAALRMVQVLNRELGLAKLSGATALGLLTVRELALQLQQRTSQPPTRAGQVHSFSVRPEAPLVVCLPPIGGTVFGYRALAALLREQHEVIGISAPEVPPGASAVALTHMAAQCRQIIEALPRWRERLVLVGWSFGGVLALELSTRFEASDLAVPAVVIDPWVRRTPNQAPTETDLRHDYLKSVYRDRPPANSEFEGEPGLDALFRIYAANARALLAHAPSGPYPRSEIFVASRAERALFPTLVPILESPEWRLTAKIEQVAADHYEIMQPPAIAQIGARVAQLARGRSCSRC